MGRNNPALRHLGSRGRSTVGKPNPTQSRTTFNVTLPDAEYAENFEAIRDALNGASSGAFTPSNSVVVRLAAGVLKERLEASQDDVLHVLSRAQRLASKDSRKK